MRKLMAATGVLMIAGLLIAIAAVMVLHREFDGLPVFLDDEPVDGAWVALGIGGAMALGLFFGFIAIVAALAWVVVLVPLVIVGVILFVTGSVLFGLVPLLVPVLLVVGACALLVRLFKRRPSPAV